MTSRMSDTMEKFPVFSIPNEKQTHHPQNSYKTGFREDTDILLPKSALNTFQVGQLKLAVPSRNIL